MLCYQTQKGLWNFFKISSSQHYPYSLPFFQKYYKHPIYSPSFHHLLKLVILFLLGKVVGTSIFKIQIENYVWKKEPQMIRIHLLKRRKRKEVKENANLVVNERFQSLVAFKRFHCLVTFERFHCSMAFERFQCLVANGRKRRNTFSPLPTFSQQILLKPSFFSH